MKCKIKIQTPSAKRLEKNRRIVIESCGRRTKEIDIPEGVDEMEFEYDFEKWDDHNRDVMGGILDSGEVWYRCYVEYRNSTGSRVEKADFNYRVCGVSDET